MELMGGDLGESWVLEPPDQISHPYDLAVFFSSLAVTVQCWEMQAVTYPLSYRLASCLGKRNKTTNEDPGQTVQFCLFYQF
ncbi:hypothetical protein H920_18050 [Fukomys damarensis]|uniref:Uncharacterized protein n=1 Tax=Fukomys damarensis TaxID=885580 RepID=A0A091CSY0_FUKDA|nr:hypothetical protein H920_18050 [Fukomys damarensis]